MAIDSAGAAVWDFDCDGDFDEDDVRLAMDFYGIREAPPDYCPGDLNVDGIVDGADLSQLLGAWGVCP